MWPCRSLVPTIEIVTTGSPSRPGAPASVSARVGAAPAYNTAPMQIALVYDARMRMVRRVLAAALIMMGAACSSGQSGPIGLPGGGGLGGRGGAGASSGAVFQQNLSRAVDILFVIDDSSSMSLAQGKLVSDFP